MESVDTICAISTPSGEGGIGILRMSGPLAHSILKTIFRTKRRRDTLVSHRLYLGHIIDPISSDRIDEVFAVFMHAPRTYTKEDIGEVYAHGGYAVQKRILSLMMQSGARLAEPGEFTKRAYLNGRIDLLQAESVLDIIESETDEELLHAMKTLRGLLSGKINGFKEKIKNVLVEVEALIDFPEEDIDVNEKELFTPLEKVTKDLKRLIDSYYEGNAVRHGLEVMIIGRTNVGKSSLLNTLLFKEKAIVTPLPGTTRDMIEDTIHIRGIKVRIVDTAGMGTPDDIVEREGIKRVKERIPEADLILWVIDGSRPFSHEDEDIYQQIKERNRIVVINKMDLPRLLDRGNLKDIGHPLVEVSALKDTGIETLKRAVYEQLMGKKRPGSLLITNLRHRTILTRALEAIEKAIAGSKDKVPLEFIAFDLRESTHFLGEITGETCGEEILREIFHRFCIGK